jgi:hypothetical protein
MRQPPKPDCYDYVRQYYNVPAYVGVRVTVRGRDGVLVDATHSRHYVHILFDGDHLSAVCHPTDGVEYFVLPHVSVYPSDKRVGTDVDGRESSQRDQNPSSSSISREEATGIASVDSGSPFDREDPRRI